MAISTSLSRVTGYYRRNSLRATIRRIVLAVKRGLFASRTVLFCCDLTLEDLVPADSPKSLNVERKRTNAEIHPPDLDQIINVWNSKLAQRNMEDRFSKGASFWIIKHEDRLAGYGWTLQGSTMEPHYFPLAQDDVHLFDFYVFPEFRGRGINPHLVTFILRSLAEGLRGRAFIETAEWNLAQLASLRRTPFRRLGWARRFTLLGCNIVWWTDRE